MIEALLAIALVGQPAEDWQEDERGTERPILSFSAYDMRRERLTRLRVTEVEIEGRRTPFVQRRIRQRRGGSAHQLTGIGCAAFAPLVAEAGRLPLPPPQLVRLVEIAPGQREDATWYRLEGMVAYSDGRIAPIRIESIEAHGEGEPSALARWGESLMRAFQACVDGRAAARRSRLWTRRGGNDRGTGGARAGFGGARRRP